MTTKVVSVHENEPNYIELETEEAEAVARKAAADERIHSLFLSLSKKRTEAINSRASSGVESRWLEDLAAYHGEEGYGIRQLAADEKFNTTAQKGARTQRRRSTQYVQKTRQKTNAGSARLSDMLLPTDDRNWEYEPTPVPELMDAIKQSSDELFMDPETGQPLPHPDQPPQIEGQPPPPQRMLTKADMAAETLRIAKERAKRMQQAVDDQLGECQFNAACRRAIDSAAQVGTGIIRGPVPMNRVKKCWKRRTDGEGKSYFDLEVQEETRPQTTFVSVWDAFPAPGCGENIHDGGFFWHREVMAPAHLKDLARLAEEEKSGYMKDALLACLKESPSRAQAMGLPEGRWADDTLLRDKNNYELWNYYGEADPEDLEALGVDMDKESNDELRLQSIAVIVTICNDKIIRAIVNPQAKGEIPYDVFQWERVAGSCWGVGVPFLMRYAQKAMNASWRQMQDNAGVSHGPQILMNKEAVHPANGDWELHGMKVWYLNEDIDPRMAFAVHHIPSNQAELQNIFMLASQLADEETSLPQLLQGDGAPDTMGATVIAQNNANVVLKRFARNWDDQMTGPHLRRYYDWNMEFNPDEEIKGDYMVQARGSTHLVVRDIRQQELMMIGQLRQTDPGIQAWVNPEKWAKKVLEATSVGDIMFTEAEKMENDERARQQPPPKNPMVEVAEIRAQAAVKAAEVDSQGEQANIALNAQEAVRNDERELAKLQLQFQMKELEAQMMMMQFAQERNLQLNDIKATFATKVLEVRSKAQMDRENRVATQQAQERMGKFKKPNGVAQT